MQPCLSSGVNLRVQDGIHRAEINLQSRNRVLSDSRVDPSAGDNYAICIAPAKGFVEIVRTLLLDPRVNPFVNDYAWLLGMVTWKLSEHC